jgi:hypothetical protein
MSEQLAALQRRVSGLERKDCFPECLLCRSDDLSVSICGRTCGEGSSAT